MTEFNLEVGKLYLLSAVPGSGKSTWLKSGNIPADMVVSTDALRQMLMGSKMVGGKRYIFNDATEKTWELVKHILSTRLKEKLTTFLDSTCIDEAERKAMVDLAAKYGVPVEVLILDRPLEQCLAQNAAREASIPEDRVQAMFDKFARTSSYPYRLVPEGSRPNLIPRDLPDTALDIVGDVHGLYEDLLALLASLGYSMDTGVPVHPEGRKLLFLGDVVDRGPKSVETLQFCRRAVLAGHYMVAGNHERKLLRFWETLQEGRPHASSPSAATTAMAFIQLPAEEQAKLVEFIRELPGFYTVEAEGVAIAFTHANLTSFHPMTILHSECLFGSEELPRWTEDVDADGIYHQGYVTGENRYQLVRGHIPHTSLNPSVFSLEARQAFGGKMLALRLDAFIRDQVVGMEPRAAFDRNVVAQQCTFNWDTHLDTHYTLKHMLDKLKGSKHVTAACEITAGLTLYKYSKRVFFDALWGDSPYLLKARGIVLDLAGNIVVHPFDKVFNYGENDTGIAIPNDRQVTAVEKLNGFLGCISKHPWKNELLVTTTGSFDSPFVEYIRSFIVGDVRGKLLRFFHKNNVTLTFEVLHPEDEHIIKYGPEAHGLWLIGARGKAQNAPQAGEDELDVIAADLGFKRPKWFNTTFGNLKEMVVKSELEGYMVRDVDTGETLLKFKTPYYLVTKFLGRMGETNVRHMFLHPKSFKKNVDEEFYPLIDRLTAVTSEADFLAMGDTERVAFVREVIAELR